MAQDLDLDINLGLYKRKVPPSVTGKAATSAAISSTSSAQEETKVVESNNNHGHEIVDVITIDDDEDSNEDARLDDASDELPGNEEKNLKKIVRKMTKMQIEEMMMTKMTELITNKSEVGQLRKEVDSYKGKIEKWQTRAQALSKQVTDLGMKHSHDDRHKMTVSWIEDQDTENIEDRILSTSELTGASQNIAEPDDDEN